MTRASTKARHNDEAVAEVLLAGEATAKDVTKRTGLDRNSVHRVIRRLATQHGLPVTWQYGEVSGNGPGAPKRYYHIIFPAGRVCEQEGCGTILRRTNPSRRCELHGGGYLDLQEVRPMSDDAPATSAGE